MGATLVACNGCGCGCVCGCVLSASRASGSFEGAAVAAAWEEWISSCKVVQSHIYHYNHNEQTMTCLSYQNGAMWFFNVLYALAPGIPKLLTLHS